MKARVVTFDGDEMNMHVPQSYEAAMELEEIAAIPHNIITPRHARPLIGVFQDSLVGSYRLTRPGNRFTRREFMNLMMRNKRFDGILPPASEGGFYTGQQVLSKLLPPLNISMGNKSYDKDKESDISPNYVKIVQGDIKQGVVDGDIYMKPGKGIVHVTYNDYGPKETTMFLDSLQRVVEDYLVLNGFSVGISDLIADEETKKTFDASIQQAKKDIAAIQLQIHSDLFENNTGKTNQQEFEDQAFAILEKVRADAGKNGMASLSAENRLVAMVKSGSKGDQLNIAQMVACVGQQSIEGKRVPNGLTDRTLPHYKKYDDGAESRGFVESSFIRGLTPQEFFFHAMTGREGLIDTAVKTADTGYIQRQLIKALEDIVVQHDGTVRDANMNVVQFYYGEDGIMATKLESQEIGLAKLSHKDIQTEFGLVGVDWSKVLVEGTTLDAETNPQATEFAKEIIADQRMLVEGVFQGMAMDAKAVNAPVNLARLILNMKVRFGLKKDSFTDLQPTYVFKMIKTLVERTKTDHVPIWKALLRYYLSPSKLIVKDRFTKNAFDAMCELIVVGHMKSWVQPGEQVGIVAAQSIGEPSTQLTLNTFHMAGVASKSNVTQGIPRLREILKVTKNPKATSLTIYMRPEFRNSKEKARQLVQDLELTLLRNITNKVGIYWDPTDDSTVIEEDQELLEFYRMLELDSPQNVDASKWLLRLEMNQEEMYNKNITMADVVFMIKKLTNKSTSIVYSDYNSSKLVVRIRMGGEGVTPDYFTMLKVFQNQLLNNCVIRGVPGIKGVTFRKDKQKSILQTSGEGDAVDQKYEELDQYILDTDGSNYVKVMNHPAVDANRLYTTNIYDVIEILGLEAVRAILMNEIHPIFAGVGVNSRHLGILCDYITRTGRLVSIDRYGINANDIGPLAKMSFEETSKIVLKAALFGEVDPVTGVSANVMMGQPFRGGTAFSQILLDDQMLALLTKNLDAVEDDEEEEAEGDLEELVDEEANDPCGRTQFQMNMSMPVEVTGLEEPDVELYEQEEAA